MNVDLNYCCLLFECFINFRRPVLPHNSGHFPLISSTKGDDALPNSFVAMFYQPGTANELFMNTHTNVVIAHTQVYCINNNVLLLLVVRSNSANAWRASKYISIGKDDL